MKRRYWLMSLCGIAAISMALPALGATPSQLAGKALKMAKKAEKRSKSADRRSKRALKKTRLGGATGTRGAEGPPGPNGASGTAGTGGAQGSPGAPGGSVAGPTGSIGLTGVTGPTGSIGLTGPVGSARAYAQVNPTLPTYVAERTSNFTGLPIRPITGVYCLTVAVGTGVDPEAVAAVASPEFGNTTTHGGTVEVRGLASGSCAAGQFAVHTFDSAGVPANGIAFSIIVP